MAYKGSVSQSFIMSLAVAMADSTFLTLVRLKNYKSIGACDVELGPLTFLIGPNGSGKSNFLDALRFVADGLRNSLDHALRDRGGIQEVRRRSSGHPNHFGLRLEFRLQSGQSGFYAFEIAARPAGGYLVQKEQCLLHGQGVEFVVEQGEVIRSTARVPPPASGDRLYLVNAAGLPEFRPVYEALSRMGFYNPSPDSVRDLQLPDSGELLARDGSNLASVLAQLEKHSGVKQRIEEYLSRVVPGIEGVDHKVLGPRETLMFRQKVVGAKHPWQFGAANMSDGTLRALAVLVALFQGSNGLAGRTPLVGIEEPETALHPAAAGVLRDSLRDASQSTQIIVTSHSPELLEDDKLPVEAILAVVSDEGETQIGPVDEATRDLLRQRLFTAGELLRLNQLRPNPKLFGDSKRQLALF
jgi:predicted ATPase